MGKWIDEIKLDLGFVKSHTLQPKWYKVLKIFLLLGFLAGYGCLFGVAATVLFLTIFLALMAFVHLLYRVKTHKWTQSWLDFVVTEENGERKYSRIGKFYYLMVVVNAVLSVAISLMLA